MVVRVAVAAARGRSRDIPRQTPPSAATLQRGFNQLFMTVRDARDLGQSNRLDRRNVAFYQCLQFSECSALPFPAPHAGECCLTKRALLLCCWPRWPCSHPTSPPLPLADVRQRWRQPRPTPAGRAADASSHESIAPSRTGRTVPGLEAPATWQLRVSTGRCHHSERR